MRSSLVSSIVLAIALACAAAAQDADSAAPAGQNSGAGIGGGYGQRGGRGGFGGGMGMMGRGLMGTVTEATTDHYTIKTDASDVYTVHIDSNTRIMKMGAGGGMRGQAAGSGEGGGTGRGMGRGNPPEQIKASDIKVGDMIRVMGDVDATAKTVSATGVMQLDPEMAKRVQEMEANFGKTWLQGKVTAIDGAKITLTGTLDNASHTVVADENTTFRKRRDPVTLADIQVGDTVRVEGSVKDGAFAATTVSVGGIMGGEQQRGPRNAPQQ